MSFSIQGLKPRLRIRGIIRNDTPILQDNPTVHAARQIEIVGDGDDRLAALINKVAQDLEHLLACRRVRASRSARRPE